MATDTIVAALMITSVLSPADRALTSRCTYYARSGSGYAAGLQQGLQMDPRSSKGSVPTRLLMGPKGPKRSHVKQRTKNPTYAKYSNV